jgi:hypothetical protein
MESQTTQHILDSEQLARMLTERNDFSSHVAGIFLGFIGLLPTSVGN